MFTKMSYYYFLLCVLQLALARGYTYQIDVWGRWDSEQKKYLYVYGLSDFHLDYNTDEQKDVLIKMILQKKGDVKILVEDPEDALKSTSSNFDTCKKGYQELMAGLTDIHEVDVSSINEEPALLRNLVGIFNDYGLDASGAECRQSQAYINCSYRVCKLFEKKAGAFGDIIQPACEELLTALAKLSIEDFKNIINEFESYSDDDCLNRWYAQVIQNVKQYTSFDTIDQSNQKALRNYLFKVMDNNEAFVKFTSQLADTKMLHELYRNRHFSEIILIMGGGHIARIGSFLEDIGYYHLESVNGLPLILMPIAAYKKFKASNNPILFPMLFPVETSSYDVLRDVNEFRKTSIGEALTQTTAFFFDFVLLHWVSLGLLKNELLGKTFSKKCDTYMEILKVVKKFESDLLLYNQIPLA